ncbi:eukaryotic peptide chain release factor GTP-binding subunit ERF3A-like [Actinia tenebrosa]|uniref:Eukaryotic peptide chain release factor GTP-binding subunit ERF3A-like n=1 Tax=Actinia tenebrosa TaxID=6105 RepID=A0A6P8I442_ACTTE|nr:eukaryotic peptide chain release factor GTP-binding subunit ERF3A-like [Actinia tenebrosa]
MASSTQDSSAPDSWDSIEDPGPGEDPSTQLKGLNINATPFVPNVNAPVFVPSFLKSQQPQEQEKPSSINAAEPTEDKKNEQSSQVPIEEATNNVEDNEDVEDKSKQEKVEKDEEKEIEDKPSTKPETTKPKKKEIPEEEEPNAREHVNIIFIGHVDAGKSTIGGHVMYLTGQVDKRTLEKYEREAKEKNRETWYLSWALDTNQEERDKGKTVEVGRAAFDTANKHFTLLDAPGHKSFVPNMISGAAQADLGVLVISARKGEFETGFERGGQTREHAMLAKTAGVKHLVVLVNKMDDPTVEWDATRYEDIQVKLTPFLKKVGFNPKTDIMYMPCSGLTGANIKEPVDPKVCPWYSGKPFLTYIDELPTLDRSVDGPVRLPIADKYRDMGTIIYGKLESGTINKGQSLILMPNKVSVEIVTVVYDEEEKNTARAGDNVKIRLKGVEEEDVSQGFVLCSPDSLCHTVSKFDAQVVILEYKSIICAGYRAVLHIHTVAEEVCITALIARLDRKTGKKEGERPRFIKQEQIAIVRLETPGVICIEKFNDFPQMGRFTLRDEGKTIAMGKVLKLLPG